MNHILWNIWTCGKPIKYAKNRTAGVKLFFADRLQQHSFYIVFGQNTTITFRKNGVSKRKI